MRHANTALIAALKSALIACESDATPAAGRRPDTFTARRKAEAEAKRQRKLAKRIAR